MAAATGGSSGKIPLSTLQAASRDVACKTRGQDGFARHLRYDDFAANWFAPGWLVMPTESGLNQIGQIMQWRKEIGPLERSP